MRRLHQQLPAAVPFTVLTNTMNIWVCVGTAEALLLLTVAYLKFQKRAPSLSLPSLPLLFP